MLARLEVLEREQRVTKAHQIWPDRREEGGASQRRREDSGGLWWASERQPGSWWKEALLLEVRSSSEASSVEGKEDARCALGAGMGAWQRPRVVLSRGMRHSVRQRKVFWQLSPAAVPPVLDFYIHAHSQMAPCDLSGNIWFSNSDIVCYQPSFRRPAAMLVLCCGAQPLPLTIPASISRTTPARHVLGRPRD